MNNKTKRESGNGGGDKPNVCVYCGWDGKVETPEHWWAIFFEYGSAGVCNRCVLAHAPVAAVMGDGKRGKHGTEGTQATDGGRRGLPVLTERQKEIILSGRGPI